jgi:hypothetical protein
MVRAKAAAKMTLGINTGQSGLSGWSARDPTAYRPGTARIPTKGVTKQK